MIKQTKKKSFLKIHQESHHLDFILVEKTYQDIKEENSFLKISKKMSFTNYHIIVNNKKKNKLNKMILENLVDQEKLINIFLVIFYKVF